MKLKAGNHIKADYGMYYHHGIYVGDGEVIAYSKEDNKSVVLTSLDEFAQGHPIIKVKHDDAKYSRDEVVYRAYSRLGEDQYNLIFNNCEHFANWCVTGNAKSDQVRETVIDAAALATVGYKVYKHVRRTDTTIRTAIALSTGVKAAKVAKTAHTGLTAAHAVGAASGIAAGAAAGGAAASTGGAAAAGIAAGVGAASGIAAGAAAASTGGAAAAGIAAGVGAAGLATVAAPVAVAGAVGYGVYKVFKWLTD